MRNQFLTSCITFPIFIAMFMISCQKDDQGDAPEKVTSKRGAMSFLDIVDARSLIIDHPAYKSGMETNGQKSNSGAGLFKISDDGVYQEINYYRIDTNYIETGDSVIIELDTVHLTSFIYPTAIFNATPDYIIACFEEQKPDDPVHPYEYNYLVRKSDGAVFELPGPRPTSGYTHWEHGMIFQNEDGSNLIQVDENDNIYYIGQWRVNKISTFNPDHMTYQALTSNVETVNNFIVDDAGNIVYPFEGKYKIRLKGGAISYSEPNAFAYWLGLDNLFYYDHQVDPAQGLAIGNITLLNNAISYHHVGNITHEHMAYCKLSRGFFFKMKTLNKIVIISGNFEGAANPVLVVNEVYNNENQIQSFLLSDLGLTEIAIGISSQKYYYLSGMLNNQPGLIRVDPSGYPHTSMELFPTGEYDIFKMVVSAEDELTFNALRMADGKIVIGQITSTGTLSILQETGNEVIQMVQIQ